MNDKHESSEWDISKWILINLIYFITTSCSPPLCLIDWIHLISDWCPIWLYVASSPITLIARKSGLSPRSALSLSDWSLQVCPCGSGTLTRTGSVFFLFIPLLRPCALSTFPDWVSLFISPSIFVSHSAFIARSSSLVVSFFSLSLIVFLSVFPHRCDWFKSLYSFSSYFLSTFSGPCGLVCLSVSFLVNLLFYTLKTLLENLAQFYLILSLSFNPTTLCVFSASVFFLSGHCSEFVFVFQELQDVSPLF